MIDEAREVLVRAQLEHIDDGSAADTAKPAKAAKPADPKPAPAKTINNAQIKVLFGVAEQSGWGHEELRAYLHDVVGVEHSKDIPAAIYDRLLLAIGEGPTRKPGDL